MKKEEYKSDESPTPTYTKTSDNHIYAQSSYNAAGFACNVALMTEITIENPEHAKMSRIEQTTIGDGTQSWTLWVPVGTRLTLRAYPMDDGAEQGGFLDSASKSRSPMDIPEKLLSFRERFLGGLFLAILLRSFYEI